MTIYAADEIIEFLEGYNQHFEKLILFLREKENRILKDDLMWLDDSLVEEQKFIMVGNNMEQQRLDMMERLGVGGMRSSQLLEIMPEERKQPFAAQCKRLESSIDEIRRLNASADDLVRRKLKIQEKALGVEASGLGTYTDKAAKVNRSVGDIIGNV